jgi:hypothetical protein
MNLKFSICHLLSVVLLFVAGCVQRTEKPFNYPKKVNIQIKDCNDFDKRITVPVAIIPFVDERTKDENDLLLSTCKWIEFAIEGLDETVTQAFSEGLQCSGANVTDVNNASLYLSGKILQFGVWACVSDYVKQSSTKELELHLLLKDKHGSEVWSKTISDKDIKMAIYGNKQLPIRSSVYVTDRYIILERVGESWTFEGAAFDYIQRNILFCVRNLLTDESFWKEVSR